MQQHTVTEYFSKLSQLMLDIEVTNLQGADLPLDQGTDEAVQMILEVGAASGKVMLVGNGGSSAVVSHVQNDLCKAVGSRALVFTEQPLLTALANDHGYGCVFERPIELWAEPDDLLLTVSSSGQSESIIRAIEAAREKGCQIVTLSGFSPENASRKMGDLNFYVSSDAYGYVETAHAALCHYMTDKARAAKQTPSTSEVHV